MGCDIHTYVEYAGFTGSDGEPYWKNFTTNGGSRNYVMFGVLAGVRVPEAKLFDPKGMPEGNLGWATSDSYWNSVVPEEHPEWADDDNFVSLEKAQGWVDGGYSVGESDPKGRLWRVSGPDWHSHSHLSADELEQALAQYAKVVAKYWPASPASAPSEWQAMLAAMRTFEACGDKSRLVFWFDN